jgi:membrane protein
VGFRSRLERFDRYQQRHAWLGFPLAVRQKYSDDQGGYLAATITYYGFFSLFPLLLVFTAILGYVLRGHPHLRDQIVGSVVGQFPVVGHDLKAGTLKGNGVVLALGAVVAIWSGMGVFLAAQNAMNQLWGVPVRRRPDFLRSRLRSLKLLLVLGAGALVTTGLGSLGTVGAHFGVGWKIGSVLLSALLNVGLFWLAFELLTSANVGWRAHRGGAIAAGLAYEALQLGGGYYVGHVLKHANNTYGTFGVVIGLLSWIYLATHIALLAAEGDVVATRKLWPRSLSVVVEQPATEADKRGLEQRAKVEERRQDEQIEVEFEEARRPGA